MWRTLVRFRACEVSFANEQRTAHTSSERDRALKSVCAEQASRRLGMQHLLSLQLCLGLLQLQALLPVHPVLFRLTSPPSEWVPALPERARAHTQDKPTLNTANRTPRIQPSRRVGSGERTGHSSRSERHAPRRNHTGHSAPACSTAAAHTARPSHPPHHRTLHTIAPSTPSHPPHHGTLDTAPHTSLSAPAPWPSARPPPWPTSTASGFSGGWPTSGPASGFPGVSTCSFPVPFSRFPSVVPGAGERVRGAP
eukprot:1367556-Rhodomonas_salina.2